jgi:hypothetical protein
MQGTTLTWDPAIKMQRAMTTLKSLMECPFTMPTILDADEVIVDKVQRIWAAYRDFYTGLGHKDAEVWIGERPKDLKDAISVLMVTNPPLAEQLMPRYLQSQGIDTGQLDRMAAMEAEADFPAGVNPGAAGGGEPGGSPGIPQPAGFGGMGQAMQGGGG